MEKATKLEFTNQASEVLRDETRFDSDDVYNIRRHAREFAKNLPPVQPFFAFAYLRSGKPKYVVVMTKHADRIEVWSVFDEDEWLEFRVHTHVSENEVVH